MPETEIQRLLEKWMEILRIKNNWDVKLDLRSDLSFPKTGDIKIDCDDRKAILILNQAGPNWGNPEETICHELLHLKMYPLDQFTESMITSTFEDGTAASNLAYTNFFLNLEITVEELTKCFLAAFGEDKTLSFSRCESKKSFEELFEGLNNLG
ncbi:MAG: hypothetical protein LUG23_01830 [Oscillospiraceae bacterium]|nr:hypothetical protein [Oscillospiraceae bacterium]